MGVELACGGTAERGTPITYTSYTDGIPANTELVAFQDGDGPFVALTGTDGVYTAQLHGERFGLLVVCSYPSGSVYLEQTYAAPSDGTSWFGTGCTSTPREQVTIRGSIRNAGNEWVDINLGFPPVTVPPPATSYKLSTNAGPGKLVARQLVNNRLSKFVAIDTGGSGRRRRRYRLRRRGNPDHPQRRFGAEPGIQLGVVHPRRHAGVHRRARRTLHELRVGPLLWSTVSV